MTGDGTLDPLEEHIAEYDTNLDGTFSVAEVKAIVEEYEDLLHPRKKERPALKIVAIILVSLCGFGAIFGVTMVANEISKDFRPVALLGVAELVIMEDKDGRVVSTAAARANGGDICSVAELPFAQGQ